MFSTSTNKFRIINSAVHHCEVNTKVWMLINAVSLWQVTIVTNNVADVGGDSGETRCQGDMEKADMVDGKK